MLGIFLQVLSVLNLLEIRQCLLHYILEVKPNRLHNSYNSKPSSNSLRIIYWQFCYQIITMEGDDVPPASQLVARYNVLDESWPRLGIKLLTCRSWLQIQNSRVGSWHVFVILGANDLYMVYMESFSYFSFHFNNVEIRSSMIECLYVTHFCKSFQCNA